MGNAKSQPVQLPSSLNSDTAKALQAGAPCIRRDAIEPLKATRNNQKQTAAGASGGGSSGCLKHSGASVAQEVPPVWVDDAARDTCFNCKKRFSLKNRRHHCRICGELFCGSCWGSKVVFSSHRRGPAVVLKMQEMIFYLGDDVPEMAEQITFSSFEQANIHRPREMPTDIDILAWNPTAEPVCNVCFDVVTSPLRHMLGDGVDMNIREVARKKETATKCNVPDPSEAAISKIRFAEIEKERQAESSPPSRRRTFACDPTSSHNDLDAFLCGPTATAETEVYESPQQSTEVVGGVPTAAESVDDADETRSVGSEVDAVHDVVVVPIADGGNNTLEVDDTSEERLKAEQIEAAHEERFEVKFAEYRVQLRHWRPFCRKTRLVFSSRVQSSGQNSREPSAADRSVSEDQSQLLRSLGSSPMGPNSKDTNSNAVLASSFPLASTEPPPGAKPFPAKGDTTASTGDLGSLFPVASVASMDGATFSAQSIPGAGSSLRKFKGKSSRFDFCTSTCATCPETNALLLPPVWSLACSSLVECDLKVDFGGDVHGGARVSVEVSTDVERFCLLPSEAWSQNAPIGSVERGPHGSPLGPRSPNTRGGSGDLHVIQEAFAASMRVGKARARVRIDGASVSCGSLGNLLGKDRKHKSLASAT